MQTTISANVFEDRKVWVVIFDAGEETQERDRDGRVGTGSGSWDITAVKLVLAFLLLKYASVQLSPNLSEGGSNAQTGMTVLNREVLYPKVVCCASDLRNFCGLKMQWEFRWALVRCYWVD